MGVNKTLGCPTLMKLCWVTCPPLHVRSSPLRARSSVFQKVLWGPDKHPPNSSCIARGSNGEVKAKRISHINDAPSLKVGALVTGAWLPKLGLVRTHDGLKNKVTNVKAMCLYVIFH